LSPASDNPAVLADVSGTVIESNAVFFEGNGFFLRPKGTGANGLAGTSTIAWGDFLRCQGLGANLGADCFGVAQPAVRYDSPTWGGFRFETSYGKNQLTGPLQADFYSDDREIDTSDTDFWDIAVFYTGDWNSIKLSAAAAYTWIETSFWSSALNSAEVVSQFAETDLFQVGASIMHKPSGLGIYGLYQHEETGGRVQNLDIFGNVEFTTSIPDSDVWYVKPFWRKAWSPIGATVLFGEYGQYNDQFAALVGTDFSGVGSFTFQGCQQFPEVFDCYVTGSEVERWGLGVVQEIDSAAMHLWARWQHQELDVDLIGIGGTECGNRCRFSQGFDDWDLFQAGGIIFF
jgi:hypothetical protein